MSKAVFERMDETTIDMHEGALRILQTDGDGLEYTTVIPGRYIREFLNECERVAGLAD
jgi:hypothetical protein